MTTESFISRVWDRLSHSVSVMYPLFQVRADHVIGPQTSEVVFKASEAYFELRICEQFLRDKREYWNEFNPLTLVFNEFIYDGKLRSFPFVVGPALLKGLEQLEGGEQVRYRNTRVVGPTPYQGDDIGIFVGLFRVQTRDWARQALSFLESVAKAFDSSKLSSYLNITGPLMDGIESFLGMGNQMQFRLGQRNVLSDPETTAGGYPFSPGYFVIVRGDSQAIDKGRFWVKDSELYVGESESNLQPYRELDYVLYQVTRLDKRNDYTTFDFHRQWEEVQKQIWSGNKAKAIEGYQHLIALIRRSPDLIPSHMNLLTIIYQARFQEESAAYDQSLNPGASIRSIGSKTYEGSLQRGTRLKLGNETIEAISKSRDLFLERSNIRSQISGPVPLDEEDIRAALDSQILDDSSIMTVDPSKLTVGLSLEIPQTYICQKLHLDDSLRIKAGRYSSGRAGKRPKR